MERIALYNVITGQELANEVKVADSFFSRLIGLLNRKELEESEGLILTKTKQIHTIGMRFPIDVVYLQRKNNKLLEVIAIEENLLPNQIGKKVKGANIVLELPAKKLKKIPLQAGDLLEIVEYT